LLLIKFLHFLSKARWSMSNLASMLRHCLFYYLDLQAWLDDPFGQPAPSPDHQQLLLPLPDFGQAAAG